MKTILLSLASAAVIVSAAPAPGHSHSGGHSSTHCPSKNVLATFDDLSALPLPQLSPVGTYDGLTFQAFDVIAAGVAGTVVTGLEPQSGANVAGNGVLADTTDGGPAFIPAAPYKTLNLHSLYFGCSVNTLNSAAGVPQGCTVAFTAYKPGSKVAYQTINERFNPTGTTVSKLAKATFPKTWQKMGKIEISVVESTATTDLTALDIDSVSYTLYECD